MSVIGRILIILSVLLGLGLASVQAQTIAPEPQKKTVVIDKRKLLVQPRNPDGTLVEYGFAEDPVLWMRTKQQNFYGRLNGAIRQMKSGSPVAAGWTLLTISFFYGVFHAAGPGHGKAVVTGWVLATENELKRGIFIAFLSAIFQALTAIVVVSVLLLFVSGASAMARDVVGFLESAGYAMIMGMGLYLAWNGWSSFVRRPVAKAAGPFELVHRPVSGGNVLDHIHDENCGCGHAHLPAAQGVRGDWSLRRAVGIALAIGIRPCSGAIAMLFTSHVLGLYWVGVISTFAMGIGVFLTIASIAALAVYSKKTAQTLVSADNPTMRFAVRWGKIAVGLALAAFGTLLFLASLGSQAIAM